MSKRLARKIEAAPYKILTGDVREMLSTIPDESVQCCVTSPPYRGLRDYGTEPQVWGGEEGCKHEWGTSIPQFDGSGLHRMPANQTGGTKDYSSRSDNRGAFCGQCNAWRGHLGLKPTPELYVEHLVGVFREVRRVLRRDGTFWLNVGDCYASGGRVDFGPCQPGTKQASQSAVKSARRSPQPPGLKPKDLVGIPWRLAFALQADGWYLRSDIIWSKPNPMPESCRDRPTKAHEYVFLLTKSGRYFFDQDAVREPVKSTSGECSVAPHGKHVLKTGHREQHVKKYDHICGANVRTVWTIPTQPFPEAHFATFPEALPERCIRAGTSERGCCPECGAPRERVVERKTATPGQKPGYTRDCTMRNDGERAGCFVDQSSKTTGWEPSCDCQNEDAVQAWDIPDAVAQAPPFDPVPCTVLDPFVGSGTTAIVSVRLGRKAIGIELNPEYAAMVENQLAATAPGSIRRPKKFRLPRRKKLKRRRPNA